MKRTSVLAIGVIVLSSISASNLLGAGLPTNMLPFPACQTQEDSIRRIKTDDFPVTNDMFEHDAMLKIDSISAEGVWLRNDSLHQLLIFILEVDYLRAVTYLFDENNISPDMLSRMSLYKNWQPIDKKLKNTYLPEFCKMATPTDAHYFTSVLGFHLGDKKQKALDYYGQPDSILIADGFEIMDWYLTGDIAIEYFEPGTLNIDQTFAEDSFGYEVMMYFKNDILTGLIFFNEEP